MTYQVLARKWRPQDFAALIGQEAVVTALSNSIAESRVAQAYLFSGIRGVGKTTAARVFAKALNCEKFGVGKRGGPCNDCPTCRDITSGADMDVLEIDAATYSKVEQVRELAESLKYGPARDAYKVVVLDEVHRLSRQAFDALLKIVEEPPPRLVFIFATTEIDAVPATILSRCQEFLFRRVSSEELTRHLAAIASAEKIGASPAALALIARAGEGSVRDAVAILDQLATFGNGEVDEREAARLMGGIDLALFHDLLAAILAGDSRRVADLARKTEENGWDPRQVHANFLTYCRDAIHLALGDDAAAVALPKQEGALLAELAGGAGYENLLRLLHHLLGSEMAIRRSEAGSLALEIAWLRAAELPKLISIEELLAGHSPAASGAPPTTTKPAKATPSGSGGPATRPTHLKAVAPLPPSEPSESAEPAEPSPPRAPLASVTSTPRKTPPPAPEVREAAVVKEELAGAGTVAAFLEEIGRRKANLAGVLQGLATITWDESARTLRFEPHDPLGAASLARANNRELIQTAAEKIFGGGAAVRVLAARAVTPELSPKEVAAAEKKSEILEHPHVQAVLDVFGGQVAAVETDGSDGSDGSDGTDDSDGSTDLDDPEGEEEPTQ